MRSFIAEFAAGVLSRVQGTCTAAGSTAGDWEAHAGWHNRGRRAEQDAPAGSSLPGSRQCGGGRSAAGAGTALPASGVVAPAAQLRQVSILLTVFAAVLAEFAAWSHGTGAGGVCARSRICHIDLLMNAPPLSADPPRHGSVIDACAGSWMSFARRNQERRWPLPTRSGSHTASGASSVIVRQESAPARAARPPEPPSPCGATAPKAERGPWGPRERRRWGVRRGEAPRRNKEGW
jgi:hypothetical protein